MFRKHRPRKKSNQVTPDELSEAAGSVATNSLTILANLRQGLTQLQLAHLDRLWELYLQTGHWPSVHEYHRGFGRKQDTIEVLESIGGNAIVEIGSFPHIEYQLTLLGILLLSDGEFCQRLLVDYFRYLKSTFESDGCRKLPSAEVGQALNPDFSPVSCRGRSKVV